MAVFKVEMPDGRILQVQAPDDASDDQIIELAKNQQAAMQGPIAPDRDAEASMNQARIAGTIAGGVNVVGTSVPGALAGAYRTVRDVNQAQAPELLSSKYPGLQGTDIEANQSVIRNANEQLAQQQKLLRSAPDASSRAVIQDNIYRLTSEIQDARSGIRMERGEAASRLRQAPISQVPARAEELAATYAPKTTAFGSAAGNLARRFVGPYGAITSAADVNQRLAEGNYPQAAISGIGAAGYGMSSLGNVFPPAKVPGMIVGGAADLANMGIDAITEYIRRMAMERAQSVAQGQYQAP